jgi:hypothetical protein
MPTPAQGYRCKDGKRVPGVTTILSRFKESGGLIHWASRLALEPLTQAYEIWRSPTDSWRDHIDVFFQSATPDVWDYKKVRDKAADAGTCAHDMFDCWGRGVPFNEIAYPGPVMEMAAPAFEAGKTWAQQVKYQVTESEVPLVSEKYRFGGTRDGVLIDGRRAIADVKTSNSIYPEYLCQIAAYAILDEEQGNTIDGGFHLLKFSKQEKPTDPIRFTHLYWSQLDLAREAFLLQRRLYDLMADLGRLVK